MVGPKVSRPANYVLRLHQRTAFDWALTWRDDNDAVVDLTGHEALFQVRRDYPAGDIGELSSLDGQITLAATGPNITVHISRDFLVGLPSNNQEQDYWIYGLKVYIPGSENLSTQTLLQGCLELD